MESDYTPGLTWSTRMSTAHDEFERAERDRELAAIVDRATAAKAKSAKLTATVTVPLIKSFADRWIAARADAALAEFGSKQAGRDPIDLLDLTLSGRIDNDNISDGNPIDLLAMLKGNPAVDTLVVRIDSNGGEASLANDVFLAIRNHRAARRVTIAEGRCHSAALDMFLAGKERICRSNATFMAHKTDGGTPEENRAFDEIGIIIAKSAGIDEAAYRALVAAGEEFDAERALELGIATAISDTDFAADDEIDEPDEVDGSFEVETAGGNVITLPLNMRVVNALARSFTSSPTDASSAVFGLPNAIWSAAMARAVQPADAVCLVARVGGSNSGEPHA
ncbi:MAG: ATP-dependent Clp protease proteolytic subunit [Mesorhizobium sp.]|nr:ATP-dependent Clp protease proteolytic subunit [Mesorhizobium sp.]MBL8579546.1 ATP-dependent Clp protease proteolytic subunit [Mesorhizobium sp.]